MYLFIGFDKNRIRKTPVLKTSIILSSFDRINSSHDKQTCLPFTHDNFDKWMSRIEKSGIGLTFISPFIFFFLVVRPPPKWSKVSGRIGNFAGSKWVLNNAGQDSLKFI